VINLPQLAPQDKIVLHPQFARYMAGERIYPVGLEVSPAGACNASCGFCFYANTGELGEHRAVFLDTERATRLLEECRELGIKAVTWTGGGDPSLHPAIRDLVKWADALGIEQGMFTNCLALPRYDPAKLAWVRVTRTDKPLREDYLAKLRACRRFGFAYNYSGPADDADLLATLAAAERVKADYVQVRPALKFHGETTDIEPPAFDHPLLHVTGYKFEDAKKKHGYAACEGYHFVSFVWEDGNVDVCGYMRKHPGYTLGNLYKSSLREILDATPASVPVIAKCQVCCKNHEINKRVAASRAVEDANFP
jgi:MoaA/NifB/PqqE/SkfB family radical SAM enzyme